MSTPSIDNGNIAFGYSNVESSIKSDASRSIIRAVTARAFAAYEIASVRVKPRYFVKGNLLTIDTQLDIEVLFS